MNIEKITQKISSASSKELKKLLERAAQLEKRGLTDEAVLLGLLSFGF